MSDTSYDKAAYKKALKEFHKEEVQYRKPGIILAWMTAGFATAAALSTGVPMVLFAMAAATSFIAFGVTADVLAINAVASRFGLPTFRDKPQPPTKEEFKTHNEQQEVQEAKEALQSSNIHERGDGKSWVTASEPTAQVYSRGK